MHFSTTVTAALVSIGYLAVPTLTAPAPADDTDPAAATAAPLVTGGTPVTNIDTAAGTKGQAHVRNDCAFPVYLYVCGQGGDNGGTPSCTPIHTLAAHTGTYAETYFSPNNGRSIKMGKVTGEAAKPILQFEYTNTGAGQVSYDLSEVNGNPFGPYGFTLTSSNPSCFQSHCAPPATSCPGVFTNPTNGVPHDCPIGDGIGVTLCG